MSIGHVPIDHILGEHLNIIGDAVECGMREDRIQVVEFVLIDGTVIVPGGAQDLDHVIAVERAAGRQIADERAELRILQGDQHDIHGRRPGDGSRGCGQPDVAARGRGRE